MPLRFDFDHSQGEYIPFVDDLFGMCHALLAEFRDMDQALHLFTQTGKSAELGQVGDRPLHQLPFPNMFCLFDPGVLLELADGQANALALTVNSDDLYLDFLSNAQHLLRMFNPLPGDFREMYQAVCAINIDEGAKLTHASDPAKANIALG